MCSFRACARERQATCCVLPWVSARGVGPHVIGDRGQEGRALVVSVWRPKRGQGCPPGGECDVWVPGPGPRRDTLEADGITTPSIAHARERWCGPTWHSKVRRLAAVLQTGRSSAHPLAAARERGGRAISPLEPPSVRNHGRLPSGAADGGLPVLILRSAKGPLSEKALVQARRRGADRPGTVLIVD